MTRIQLLENPTLRSNVLFQLLGSYLAMGRYPEARKVAKATRSVCDGFHLGFATPYCLQADALACLGLGNTGEARQLSARLKQLATAGTNPYLTGASILLDARLLLISHRPQLALELATLAAPSPLPPFVEAELLALGGLSAAILRESQLALGLLTRASALTREPAISFLIRLAACIPDPPLTRIAGDRTRLVFDMWNRQLLDPLITAFHAYPVLLQAFASDTQLQPTIHAIFRTTSNPKLSGSIGLPREGREALTRREREVLALIRVGMSNSQIARELCITESTAKVHVRHIFRKLGVETRLQAGLAAAEDMGEN